MIFCTLTYNNYFNRIIKRGTSYADYSPFLFNTTMNVNFNEGDGINAQFVLTSMQDQRLFNDAAVKPDYAVYMDDYYNIVSRWFIVESHKERGGQYVLTLKRDVVADNLPSLLDQPFYAERAHFDLNSSSPFLFNKEGMTFNQIKSGQALLLDKTKNAKGCVVGYVDKFKEDITVNVKVDENRSDLTVDEFKQRLGNWLDPSDWTKSNVDIYAVNSIPTDKFGVIVKCDNKARTWYRSSVWIREDNKFVMIREEPATMGYWMNEPSMLQNYLDIKNSTIDTLKSLVYTNNDTTKGFVTDQQLALIVASDGLTIFDDTTKINYICHIVQTTTDSPAYFRASDIGESFFNTFDSKVQSSWKSGHENVVFGTASDKSYELAFYPGTTKYNIVVERATSSATATIKSSHTPTTDSAYDVFCIPCDSNVTLIDGTEQKAIYISSTDALQLACAVATGLGTHLYDIQLLPYCPLPDTELNQQHIIHLDPNGSTLFKTPDGTIIGAMLWCQSANRQFVIDMPITNDPTKEDSISNYKYKKVSNECDMWRLSAPNASAYFDFSPSMNGGVTLYDVYMTCKPLSPYIRVCPQFGGLYGSTFNDYRGLILGGDYSLPIVSDAWVNYQINNKNYDNIFRYNVETLDLEQSIKRTQLGWGIGTGVLGGAGAGGALGSVIAGLPGAFAVGGLGTAASIAGGIADYKLEDKLMKRQKDSMLTMQEYSIGNVKALPNTLAKVGAFHIDSVVVPFVEYYTCTKEERESFKRYLEWYGCKLGQFVKLNDLLDSNERRYVQGSFVRIENIQGDSHMVDAINDEFKGGVYI